MALYTMTIEDSITAGAPPHLLGDVSKMVKWARDNYFNFAYNASSDFRELFEERFLLYYWSADVNEYSFELWLAKLKNETQIKAPIYARTFQEIQKLMANDDLSFTEKEKYLENFSTKTTSEGTTTSKGTSNNKSSSSQFPQSVLSADDFSDIKFMDAGARSESGTNTDSTSNVSGDENSERKTERTRIENPLDVVQKLQSATFNVIENCVLTFSDLFLQVF